MKKNVIIVVLSVLVIMLFASVRKMSNEASYWMQRCDASERVIERVEEDKPSYVMDGLSCGQEWEDWTNLDGDQ